MPYCDEPDAGVSCQACCRETGWRRARAAVSSLRPACRRRPAILGPPVATTSASAPRAPQADRARDERLFSDRRAARARRDRARALRRLARTSASHSSTALERRSVSVPGLYVSPHTAIRRSSRAPKFRSATRWNAHPRCVVLLVSTPSMSGVGTPAVAAELAEEHDVARQRAARERCARRQVRAGPMRLSVFSPRSTSLASAPVPRRASRTR